MSFVIQIQQQKIMGCDSSKQKNSQTKNLKISSNDSITKFKTVLLGNSSVGKSSIACRYINGTINTNYGPTVGGVFFKKEFTTKSGNKVALNLWDTAGEEKYRAMAPLYYRDASVCIIVYDVTDKQSFKAIDYWIEELEDKTQREQMKLFVVGNKSDSPKRVIEAEQANKKFRNNKSITYCETSATTGVGINQLFANIFNYYQKIQTS